MDKKSLNDFHSSSPQTHLSGYLQRQENEYIKKKYNFNTMYLKFHKKINKIILTVSYKVHDIAAIRVLRSVLGTIPLKNPLYPFF